MFRHGGKGGSCFHGNDVRGQIAVDRGTRKITTIELLVGAEALEHRRLKAGAGAGGPTWFEICGATVARPCALFRYQRHAAVRAGESQRTKVMTGKRFIRAPRERNIRLAPEAAMWSDEPPDRKSQAPDRLIVYGGTGRAAN